MKEMIKLLWWTDDLKTGIDLIDQQHKSIFLKASEIFEMGENTDIEELKKVINFLMSYTNKHFLEEEQLMIDSSYSEYSQHKDGHNMFVKEIYKLYLRVDNGEVNDELFNDLKILIIEWLAKHINNEDKEFVAYFNTVKKT